VTEEEKKNKKFHIDVDESKEEIDTEDIYSETQREKMLDEDEITAAESAFMQGREMKEKNIKRIAKNQHSDTVSVELAEDEYYED
jgi:hypothetical protein